MRDDRLEIFKKLETFVKAWESGELDQINDIMIGAPFTNLSIFGPVYSREVLKCRLRDSCEGLTFSQFMVTNPVCKVREENAQQSAVLTGVVSDGVREDYHFCGTFVNSFIKTEKGWQISRLDFDLMEDNTVICAFDKDQNIQRIKREDVSFAIPDWNLIWDDLAVYDECRLPSICGELQAPWSVISEDTQDMTDEEAVKDLFYRYAFAVDHRTVSLLPEAFEDGAVMKLSPYGEFGKEKGIQFLKWMKSAIGQRGQHVAKFEKIKQDDKFAQAVIKCESPGIINGVFELSAIKEDNVWRILSLTYSAL